MCSSLAVIRVLSRSLLLALFLAFGWSSATADEASVQKIEASDTVQQQTTRDDGSQRTEEALSTRADRDEKGAVQCSARCIIRREGSDREKVTAQQSRKVTSAEMCRTWCNRFCFGPQGNGATHVDCSH